MHNLKGILNKLKFKIELFKEEVRKYYLQGLRKHNQYLCYGIFYPVTYIYILYFPGKG